MLGVRCGKKRAASQCERVRLQQALYYVEQTLRSLAYSLCTPGGFHLRYCVSAYAELYYTWMCVCRRILVRP